MPDRSEPPEGRPPQAAYPSHLSDAEWAVREILNAIGSVLRGGMARRALPHDLPPRPTVWSSVRRWRDDGTWKRVQDALHRQVREAPGRPPEPSAGVLGPIPIS